MITKENRDQMWFSGYFYLFFFNVCIFLWQPCDLKLSRCPTASDEDGHFIKVCTTKNGSRETNKKQKSFEVATRRMSADWWNDLVPERWSMDSIRWQLEATGANEMHSFFFFCSLLCGVLFIFSSTLDARFLHVSDKVIASRHEERVLCVLLPSLQWRSCGESLWRGARDLHTLLFSAGEIDARVDYLYSLRIRKGRMWREKEGRKFIGTKVYNSRQISIFMDTNLLVAMYDERGYEKFRICDVVYDMKFSSTRMLH